MLKDVSTYRDLLSALQSMSDEQLNQIVQIADPPTDCRPVPLAFGIAIGTVGDFEFEGARSVVDNQYHADEVVILIDGNPFASDGAMGYTLDKHGPDSKPIIRKVPIYGKKGPTSRESQLAATSKEFPQHLAKVVNTRGSMMKRALGESSDERETVA